MGTYQLSTLRSDVRSNLGNRTDITDTEIDRAINLAQMRVARRWLWEELERSYDATLPDTGDAEADKKISFDNNFREVYSFRLIIGEGQSRKLTQLPPRQFDASIPEPEYYARRKPLYYTVWNNVAEVWPVQDDTYKAIVRASVWPNELVNDSDLSELDRKDDILIAFATSWLFEQKGFSEESTKWFRIGRSMLENALSEEETLPDRELKAPVNYPRRQPGEYWRDPFFKGK